MSSYLTRTSCYFKGFLGPVSNHPDLDVSQEDVNDLFINVEEIYNFNWLVQ